jgi:hypothetical protein
MIVNLFRHTQVLSIVTVFILCVAIWFGFSFQGSSEHITADSPIYSILVKPLVQYSILEQILVCGLVFSQCLIINVIVVGQRILSTNTFFPALFYFLLISAFPQEIYLSPALIAITFVLLSIKEILGAYLQKEAHLSIFDTAVLLSIATLFYPPFVILIPLVWIGMSIFSQVEWRHWALSVVGIICPWFILFTISTYFEIEVLSVAYFRGIEVFNMVSFNLNYQEIISISATGIISLLAIFELAPSLRRKNIKSRKSFVLLLWILLLSIIGLFFGDKNLGSNFLIFAIPLSVIISNYFYYHKKELWLNLLLIALMIAIGSSHLISY